jgi:hypothetical protein
LLFQSYTGGRLAEFVHSSKGKASEDPLEEADETNKNEQPRRRGDEGDDKGGDADNGLVYNDNSDANDSPEYNNDDTFDCDDDDLSDEGTNESASRDSGYSSDRTDVAMTADTDGRHLVEVDGAGGPVQQKCDAAELDEFREAVRKCKALCYEDICLWIVKNPKNGERDVLAMEVHLQHHKGVDNKPKPYVPLKDVQN